ncbi:gustatory and odorant receptor 22-like isoform X2 [Ostrinia nubilalis]|uniref:gustatory and odorant receptor 22-like isoform X2 n=1 Tax=Ostrinia nubilalis TaxID=29057 RepID=UPI0030822EEB
MIPDHLFDEGINNTLYQNDMKQVQSNKHVYERNQRDYEQEQRDLLSSQDGDTCEIHDQFYRDHKLLLVLFRALAVMPITRSRPGTITFSWRSSATAYAICFYIATTVVVLVVGYERILILRSIKKFDDYIYAILFVVFLVPHFWIPFVGWGVAHQVAIYKTNWGKFQDVGIECSAKLISRYRYLWLNLSELLQLLGNAYARTYSTYCLFMFTNITIAVYGALSEIVDHGIGFSFKEIGLFVDTVYCSTLLFIFADCSHNSTQKVADGVQETLLSIDVLSVDRPTQKEIDHFIQAIEMNPAVVSLKGYANVNRELLTSAISMITIYLIVLLQFKISLPKDPQMPAT